MCDFPILTAHPGHAVVGALVCHAAARRAGPSSRRRSATPPCGRRSASPRTCCATSTARRHGYQFVETTVDRALGVRWIVGVDGISLFMVALTALLFPIGLLASAKTSRTASRRTRWMLLLEGAIIGMFLSLDLILFFVFFESCSSRCTSSSRDGATATARYAAMKFFLYTDGGLGVPVRRRSWSLAFLHQARHRRPHLRLPGARRDVERARRAPPSCAVPRRSWSRSRSRCRCSRSTPGCPTRTPTRRPPARWCWPA